MIKYIYPSKDATIYQRFPEKNTGTDAILELTKVAEGEPAALGIEDEYWYETYNSRILLWFNLSDVSQSIVSGKISPNFTASLKLKATEATALPLQYDVKAAAISSSWINGTGFFSNNPSVTNGVSWKYRTSKNQGQLWPTASLTGNVTASWAGSVGHGGTWFTGSNFEATQSFDSEAPDINMNVTNLVRTWISGSIPNEGMIIKFPESVENDTSILGSIKFFSRETHTVFIPRLELSWDDSEFSGTGSLNEVSSEDFVLYTTNMRESYRAGEITKVRFNARTKYPLETHATSSNYLIKQRLPTSSYYRVIDYWTEDIIAEFSNGTKMSCDSAGNYFRIDMGSFLPERYYRFQIRADFDGGDTKRIIDDGFIFKVVR